MTTISDIKNFVASEASIPEAHLSPGVDLFHIFRIDGDDCDELLTAFSRRFNVDMSGYLWYFHHAEEASMNPGGLVFRPPNARVARIP